MQQALSILKKNIEEEMLERERVDSDEEVKERELGHRNDKIVFVNKFDAAKSSNIPRATTATKLPTES